MVNASLTAVAVVLMAKPTWTGPAWMPSPSLIAAVALNSPAMPALVIRKRPLPCVIETPTSPAPRKSVTFAAAMRMIGASSEVLRTLSAPAPTHALEGERAAELLAGDLDQVGGRGADLDAQASSA